MSKHTQGPWRVNGPNIQSASALWADQGILARLPGRQASDIEQANAALIAAAPEMLAFINAFLDGGDTPTLVAEAKALKAKAEKGE